MIVILRFRSRMPAGLEQDVAFCVRGNLLLGGGREIKMKALVVAG
jgi:hypothetical protein